MFGEHCYNLCVVEQCNITNYVLFDEIEFKFMICWTALYQHLFCWITLNPDPFFLEQYCIEIYVFVIAVLHPYVLNLWFNSIKKL